MKVVYGHTDSIYVQIEDVEKAKKTCEIINEHVKGLFPNIMGLEKHPVNLEFEKFYKALGVGCLKNRNAGFISWKDGEWLAEPEFVVTGFSMKRMTETALGREVQSTLLKMWAEENSESEIVEYLCQKYNDVIQGKIPIEQVVNRSRIRGDRLKVKLSCGHHRTMFDLMKNGGDCGLPHERNGEMVTCYGGDAKTLEGKKPTVGSGIAGVLYHNTANPHNPITDSFVYVKIIPELKYGFFHPFKKEEIMTTYVSAHEMSDLEELNVDWMHYANSVVKKAKPVFQAMGWDINQIKKDKRQKTLDDWW